MFNASRGELLWYYGSVAAVAVEQLPRASITEACGERSRSCARPLDQDLNGAAMSTNAIERDPISSELIGDSGPWTWALPTLVRALNDPRGPWSPPPAPWSRHTADVSAADPIAYWAPLTTLTWGVLGWVRPDLGVQRWLAAGRPTDTAPLMVLDRWWGEDALALTAWMEASTYPHNVNVQIHAITGDKLSSRPIGSPVRRRPEWGTMPAAGDSHHLGHVLDHLLGSGFIEHRPQLDRLVHDSPTGAQRDAHLVLDTYCGWYATLARLGAELPIRTDGRSWRVHVTVKPVGFLGIYRRSTKTGRWFSGRHAHHMFGASNDS
ncbi:hypothetical protein [Blastococcus sp. SYSU D00820]